MRGQKQLFDFDPFLGRSTSEVTFKGKLRLPIHRWYRLTPSFSPYLADDIADHFGLTNHDFVLDPFGGVGTVPLCMKYRGIPACSVELNPYLHYVSAVKNRTYHDVPAIRNVFRDFMRQIRASAGRIRDPEDYLGEHHDWIPRIHNPTRWWSVGNLAQLVCMRRAVYEFGAKREHLDLLKMGVLGILIPASNAKHNHVSLTFAAEPLPTVNVVQLLEAKLGEIATDLEAVDPEKAAEVQVFLGDSKYVSRVLKGSRSPSAVITSPPYPNRFSYARETRPHMFFFDFVEDAQAVGELETVAVGGTWGKATSVLQHGVEPANDRIRSLLVPYLSRIDGSGELMASYVTKYFNDMDTHAREMAKVCQRTQLAYVIGNSKFYGHPLPSDEILASIFEAHGFKRHEIKRMRKRQSKTGLYEAVVLMGR